MRGFEKTCHDDAVAGAFTLELEGVQVCVSSQHNIDLLQSAGFKSVDCFWRWINFAGWVAVK